MAYLSVVQNNQNQKYNYLLLPLELACKFAGNLFRTPPQSELNLMFGDKTINIKFLHCSLMAQYAISQRAESEISL